MYCPKLKFCSKLYCFVFPLDMPQAMALCSKTLAIKITFLFHPRAYQIRDCWGTGMCRPGLRANQVVVTADTEQGALGVSCPGRRSRTRLSSFILCLIAATYNLYLLLIWNLSKGKKKTNQTPNRWESNVCQLINLWEHLWMPTNREFVKLKKILPSYLLCTKIWLLSMATAGR